MIKRIFFDLDNTLLSSVEVPTDQNPVDYGIEDGDYDFEINLTWSTIYTKIRPCSHKIIQIAKNCVGEENVYILTAGKRDYAKAAVEKGNLRIENKNIFAREDWDHWSSYHATQNPFELAEYGNVLIDNEEIFERNAQIKMLFLGIINYGERYLKIPDYYGGEDLRENDFIAKFESFLKLRS